ncbi:Glutathione S-transferase, unnamed subgroup [hydrothermal vent metagenome]|uniref:Glutathione S-transferase, unnamed subgroup n=1 Tax=hydrothermal vent metagenome TaxID=652676 RepID=A0A3B0XD95_9ZZZZ
MIRLHGLEVSGNTYKIKLLLNLLNIKYEFIPLDIKNKQHKSEAFLKLNPRGEFPVLEDGSLIVWDSQAILIYLAKQYGTQENNHWYPDNAPAIAHITQWLTVANGEIFLTLGKARAMLKFGYAGDLELAQKRGIKILQWIDQHLKDRNWLATEQPSIADITCYPYIALCEEGDISLSHYPAIHRWFKRIQNINGYVSMPGIKRE